LAPAITVLSPNGGEVFTAGNMVNVMWTSANVANVDIFTSTDGGTTWTQVADNFDAAAGAYAWASVAGENMLVKVQDAASTTSDRSDQVFNVSAIPPVVPPAPSIVVLAPNGGESFTEGDDVNVLFSAVSVDMVNVLFSMDGGDVWTTADANVDAAGGKYVWEAVAGDNVLVKVADVDGAAADMSDQVFTVAAIPEEPPVNPPVPSVTLLSPNGGEAYTEGDFVNILWSAANVDKVDIMYSLNGGDTWNEVDSNFDAAIGKFVWEAVAGNNVLIKVADAASDAADKSDQVFLVAAIPEEPPVIPPDPTITVLFPNGGEVFVAEEGYTINILWDAQNFAADAMATLEYQIDGGNWANVMVVDPAVAEYEVAQAEADRLQAIADTKQAEANAIKAANDATLNSLARAAAAAAAASNNDPENEALATAAANAYIALANFQNNANAENDAAQALADAAQAEADAQQAIADALFALIEVEIIKANDELYVWPADTSLIGKNVRVRVRSLGVVDMSDQVFTVVASSEEPPAPAVASITVLSPKGAEAYVEGDAVNILWMSEDVETVDIKISNDGGDSWTEIAAGVDATLSKYVWEAMAGMNLMVKVVDADDATVYGESMFVFNVMEAPEEPPVVEPVPALMLLFPNGGEVFTEGDAIAVIWSAENVDMVDILVSLDGGASWDVADANVDAGLLMATVTVQVGQNVVIKVADVDSDAADMSDQVFTVSAIPLEPPAPDAKTIAVTAPTGTVDLTAGTLVDVKWTAENTEAGDQVDILAFDGTDWTSIAGWLPVNGVKFVWTAEKGVTKIKVQLCGDADVMGESAALTVVEATVTPQPDKTITAADLAAEIVEGTPVDVTWAAVNYSNSDQVQVYAFDATNWKAVGNAVAADGAKVVWVAELGVTKIKVQLVSDMNVSGETAAFVIVPDLPYVEPSITLLAPNGGDKFVEGASVNVLWTSANVDMVNVLFSFDGGETWESSDANLDAALGKYVWEAVAGDNVRIKVAC